MTQRVTTIRDVMESVFPNGYLDHPQYLAALARTKKGRRKKDPAPAAPFSNPPCSATDLFALMGQLLLKSGAYHHVCPEVDGAPDSDMVEVTAAERSKWIKIGAEWRGKCNANLPAPPAGLIVHWNALMGFAGERVFRSPGYTQIARQWWIHALALFAIADEAALDIGFRVNDEPSAQAQFIEVPIRISQELGRTRTGPLSISKASTDILCVLPKSRTTAVGCTLRSLSHNLAMLPGRGIAHARWSLAPATAKLPKDGDPEPFNLVVLPLPYRIEARAFKAFPAPKGDWGWFEVDPHWCPRSERDVEPGGFSDFAVFVDTLLDEAARDCGTVHALVLPEVALSEEVFRALCRHLQNRPGFELLISGLFDGRKPGPESVTGVRSGNFAGMARFVRGAKTTSFDLSVREKHHRWRLDRAQIETYALGATLDVNRNWWEHIDILQRALDIFVLRSDGHDADLRGSGAQRSVPGTGAGGGAQFCGRVADGRPAAQGPLAGALRDGARRRSGILGAVSHLLRPDSSLQ